MYGVEAQYHLMPDQAFDPWVGLGVGLENANVSASANGQSSSFGTSGFDFVTVMGGADYKVMPSLGVGPFVNFSLGQYNNASSSEGGQSSSSSIQNTALHEWLTLGVRGYYDISIF